MLRTRSLQPLLELPFCRGYATQTSSRYATARRPATFIKPGTLAAPRPQQRSKAEKSSGKESQDEKTKKLLRPHVLSERLKKLCSEGKVDDAVALLKKMPLDAQNTPVWNTLIWECMKTERYALAYRLFTEMKRRGFSPTTRTFQTMFTGLSRITRWEAHTKQMANARQLYAYFIRHLEEVKKHDPSNKEELSVTPLASYIKILGDAGLYQNVFDVYYAMDQDGLLAPNALVYTSLLRAIAQRRDPSDHSDAPVGEQNASDVKLIWRQIQKAATRSDPPLQLDSHVVTAALQGLLFGRPATDLDFGLEIIREQFGLTKPDESEMKKGKSELSAPAFEMVLALCNNMQRPDLCVHFAKQVMRRKLAPGEVPILDRLHIEHVIRAHGVLAQQQQRQPADSTSTSTSTTTTTTTTESETALSLLEWMLKQEARGVNGPKIRPATSTYKLVLLAALRTGDWRTTMRTFDLMTGYHSREFRQSLAGSAAAAAADGDAAGARTSYTLDKRSQGRNIVPDSEAMAYILRTALKRTGGEEAMGEGSNMIENVKQTLRIIDLFGADHFFLSAVRGKDASGGRTNDKHTTHHRIRLATAIREAVERIERTRKADKTRSAEEKRWVLLSARAREFLKSTSRNSPVPPSVEEEGSSSAFIEQQETAAPLKQRAKPTQHTTTTRSP